MAAETLAFTSWMIDTKPQTKALDVNGTDTYFSDFCEQWNKGVLPVKYYAMSIGGGAAGSSGGGGR